MEILIVIVPVLLVFGLFLAGIVAFTVSIIANLFTNPGNRAQRQREDLNGMLGDPRDRP